jgi:hypothetical protein
MPEIAGYIATGAVALIVGLLLRSLEPKAKVVYWSPHNFFFELKRENVVLQTNSLTIQNIGRKPAENIEIIHKTKPDFFQISPSMPFSEENNASGEHILRIASLGSREAFTLQLLSYKTVPVLLYVRFKEGPAIPIQIQPQRIFPKWLQYLSSLLIIVGAGFVLYWLIRAVIFLSCAIGIV